MVLIAVMAAALVLVLWGWLVFYLQPQWLVSVVQRRFSSDDVLFYVEGEERRIALTIDDAPSNSTDAILDELKAAGAKATFFIISSYVEGREAVVRRMVAEGHELGNHHTKDEASWRLAPHLFEADLLACERVIEQYQPWSSRPHKWYRPGQGFFTSAMLALLKPHKYRLALGNIYPHDANGFSRLQSDWPGLNALYLKRRARAGGVMVVHDRPWTIEVLRNALPDLAERFELVTLSQLVEGQQGQPSAAAAATDGGGARQRLRKGSAARKD